MFDKMKATKIFLKAMLAAAVATGLGSCSDWLTEPTPGQTNIDDFYTSWQAAVQNVNAAYVPLGWEYQDTYYSEWFIGDIVSDDALKGGEQIQTDMAAAYEMENWKTQTDNDLLLQYYRAKYQGIQRCNLVLQRVPEMDDEYFAEVDVPAGLKERILGEAYFLRGFYYFQLVRVFGGVPLVLDNLLSDADWQQPRASVEAVYDQIIEDLENAEKRLWKKNDSRYDKAKDLGRVTKGAAQAMLLKANLYRGQYEVAVAWGDLIISSNEYQLENNYADNWSLTNENGVESVFEIQYMEDPTSDYGEGNGFSRGTFTQVLTRSRSEMFGSNTGWGFNKPTHNLYDEYEAGDPRRDATIWDATGHMTNEAAEGYYGMTPYCSRKYAIYTTDASGEVTGAYALAHASRGPLNYKLIRYADVLLMYAEACEAAGVTGTCGVTAEGALEMVRSRARSNAEDPSTALPEYPNYKIKINGNEIQPTLREAIRHERRVELAMEGHRWFDICRWKGFDGNGVKAHMDAYAATECDEARRHMAEFVEGKHELFPIPEEERMLNPMDQNPYY